MLPSTLNKSKERRCSALTLVLLFLMLATMNPAFAQVNTGGSATTANHSKQVIGYLSNWDAWKAAPAGVPAQGALNHLNIDYAKYTILNYSFFGVAKDGSLHSGDFRNKNIYQPGSVQEPADIFFTDTYSSWDMHLLFGELELAQYISQDVADRATAQGFQVQVNGTTWSHPTWGLFNKPLPIPLHKVGGAPGVLELAHSRGVKVMASIGGWSMCKHFPEMAADPVKRQKFVNDCVKLVNTGFDGIDLDWEFVGPFAGMNFTGSQADFVNFTNLVQAIRNAIGPNKLITAAFGADPAKLQGFEWSKLNNIMNYYNMMTYDFNGGWSNIAGHNSPLYTYPGAEAPNFNWKATYDALINLGVPKSKINMGSPFYGRGVVTSGNATLNAPTVKRAETVQPDGPITTCADYVNWPRDVYDGTPNYFFVKQVALAPGSGWTRSWDNAAKVPYVTKGQYFCSYDDEESIGHKAQFIVDNQLAGTIVWTVFGDLELSGSPTQFGTRLIRYPTVKSVLINKMNEVFASGPGNPPPSVSITSPANNASFTAPATVTINATASDNGSVTKVDFYRGSTLLGTDTSTPYSFTWSNAAAGSYALTAVATDNLGATTTSSVVNISVIGSTFPTVSITSPTNNSSFTAPATVTINANASDSDGTISKVDFYNGSTLLGTDTSTPYSFTWSNVAAGSYSLTARATDNAGNATTSAAVNITVTTTPGGLPAPWQTADIGAVAAAGSASHSNGTFTLQGSGADIWGTADEFRFVYQTLNGDGSIVARVTALTNTNAWAKSGVMIRESLTAGSKHASTVITPSSGVSFPRRTTTSGTSTSTTIAGQTVPKYVRISRSGSTFTSAYSSDGVTFTTVSTISITMATNVYIGLCLSSHNDGVLANSTMTNVSVTGGSNVAPTASISSPANGATFTAPASVTINATATDSDGTITKVDFFNGSTLLGTDTSSPYSYTWTNVGAGSYTLTARATDNAGATGTSSAVNITVSTGSNINPTASISSPASGATYTAPASVTINANASDSDGTITKVDFFNGSTLLGTDTSSPYSYTWTNVGAGSYTLTVRATDNASGTGTSSAVNITVNTGSNINPTASISSPANGATYTAPASVTINANASDSDGTISKVDFFNGSTLIGTDNTSPYSFTWTNVAAGSYTLTARATDNAGGTGTSSGVSITVSSGSDNCSSTAQYVENGGYVAGSLVKNVGNQYECKPYPFSGWCNGAAWAYAPGTGTYWQDAWILKGACTGGAGARSVGSAQPEEQLNGAETEEDDLAFYPNPGITGKNQTLTLTFKSNPGNIRVHMKNINGSDVFTNSYRDVQHSVAVDLPGLSKGLYILRVKGAKKSWSRKFLVQ